jgi:HEAT repeat protein
VKLAVFIAISLLSCACPGSQARDDAPDPPAAPDDAALAAPENDAMPQDQSMSPAAVEAYIERLADEHPPGRAEAEDWLLAHIDAAHPRLVELATSGRNDLRVAGALRVLGRLGRASDVPMLAELAGTDPSTSSSWDAARALAAHAAPEAERALLVLADADSAEVAGTALIALGERGGPAAREALEAHLAHASQPVRFKAVRGLIMMGAGPSAEALRARRQVEQNDEVRRAIDEALAGD